MNTSVEKLLILANELENPDNEILVQTEDNQVEKVAEALVKAADVLREAAEELMPVEVNKESLITPESLEELAILAEAFDDSDDEQLQKSAAVIDELLLTICSDRSLIRKAKETEDNRIETLKKIYHDTLEKQHELNGTSKEAVQAIQKSDSYQEYRSLESPLECRTCIDHPGSSLKRVGQDLWQCVVDNKVYNWREGFETLQGNKVKPSAVENQSHFDQQSFSTFNQSDTRAGRHGQNSD